MNQTIEENIQHYTRAWNEKNGDRIKRILKECFSAEGTYIDKNNPLTNGIESITELILSSYHQLPVREFSVTGLPDYHNKSGRFFWNVKVPDNGSRNGMDYFEYDSENKITRIVGFI